MALRKVTLKGGQTRYRVDWRDEFGIRRRKFFDLKADAENFENDAYKRARDAKTGTPPNCHPDVTLTEYSKLWLENREAHGIDTGTVSRNEIDLRRHVLPRFGTKKVREIHRPAVKAFLLGKLSDGECGQGIRPGRPTKTTRKKLARGSVLSIYHTLSGILSEAVEDQLIVANPIRGLWKKLSKGKADKAGAKKVKAFDADQARHFLGAAQTHEQEHYAFFCALMWAGLRPGEGFALTADKIDLRQRSILVDEQIGQHGGLKTTKTDEPRTVDVSAKLAAVLADVVRARKAAAPGPKAVAITDAPARPVGPWLFYPDLGPNPNEKDVQRVYKRALAGMRRSLEKAGLPAHFSLHSLRHTYGSGLVSRGVSPAYVRQQMGHASIQQTVDTYGSWLPIRVPGAVDALADATAPGSDGHFLDTLGGLGVSAAR